jgi:hypothetical protein
MGGAGELLDWVAVFDVVAYELAPEAPGQRLGMPDSATGVVGAVVADEHRPGLRQRGVGRDGHERARCLRGEVARDAAAQDVLKPPARRRPADEQGGLALRGPAPELLDRPACEDRPGRVLGGERAHRSVEILARRRRHTPLLELVEVLAQMGIPRRAAGRQRWERAGVEDVHELEGRAELAGEPGGGVGGEHRRLGDVEGA